MIYDDPNGNLRAATFLDYAYRGRRDTAKENPHTHGTTSHGPLIRASHPRMIAYLI